MARPTRKHVNYNALMEGPQGRQFIRWTAALMSNRMPPEPVASFPDGSHLWVIRGDEGLVLWIEMAAADGAGWIEHIGVRPLFGECAIQLEFTGRRWDSFREAELTGDRTLVDGPRGRRYRIEAERRAADARGDRVAATVTAVSDAPVTLCRVPLETLVEAVTEHEKRRPARLARRAKAYRANCSEAQRQHFSEAEALWRRHEGQGWHIDVMRGTDELLVRLYDFDEAVVAIETLLERYEDSEEPLLLRIYGPDGDSR